MFVFLFHSNVIIFIIFFIIRHYCQISLIYKFQKLQKKNLNNQVILVLHESLWNY